MSNLEIALVLTVCTLGLNIVSLVWPRKEKEKPDLRTIRDLQKNINCRCTAIPVVNGEALLKDAYSRIDKLKKDLEEKTEELKRKSYETIKIKITFKNTDIPPESVTYDYIISEGATKRYYLKDKWCYTLVNSKDILCVKVIE
jgi:hypothetical protein